jgi:DNA-binding response OmpR family regulator
MKNDKKQTILIVEDEPALLKAYVEQFTEEGFSVLQAQNGQEGYGKALKGKPDILLLDILMPVMDGLTMMQNLRENEAWDKSIPIVFLTNLSANEERIMKIITENKPAYYFSKSSLTLRAIVETVREKLALRP